MTRAYAQPTNAREQSKKRNGDGIKQTNKQITKSSSKREIGRRGGGKVGKSEAPIR